MIFFYYRENYHPFIYSVLPTFLYALFIYGISLRRASMTGKNINICELWLVNYYEYSACDAMRTRVTHFDSFQASELPTWCLIIWPNESKTVLFTPLFHWSDFIYAFLSLVMTSLGFVSHDWESLSYHVAQQRSRDTWRHWDLEQAKALSGADDLFTYALRPDRGSCADYLWLNLLF